MRGACVAVFVGAAALVRASPALAAPTAEWQAVPSMASPRDLATATVLADGDVLVVGGESAGAFLSSAERFVPGTRSWKDAASLDAGRDQHVAALLDDGRVLVAGGYGGGRYLASAALYDGAEGAWSAAEPMNVGRLGATGTVLADGRVLLAGGYNDNGLTAAAELFDGATGVWLTTGAMSVPRNHHTATALPDGRVLVAGGFDGAAGMASTEVFDPLAGTWSSAAPMIAPRWFHVAVGLEDGRVLVAGGHVGGAALASAEVYDPTADQWSVVGSMQGARFAATAVPWRGGVLVAGGSDGAHALASVEWFDPVTESFSPLAPMQHPRFQHLTVGLADGSVLVAGGSDDAGALATAELFGAEACATCGSGGGGGASATDDGGEVGGDGCACATEPSAGRAPWFVALALGAIVARRRRTRRAARGAAALVVVLGCGAPAAVEPAPGATLVDGAFVHCTERLPKFCLKACEAGDGEACRSLAVALRDHDASRVEYGTLVDRLKQAANHGLPDAYLDLAKLYATGGAFGNETTGIERVPPDRALAASYARMGCDRGLGASCYQLGLLLESDDPPDLPRSLLAYRAAAEQGEPMGAAAVARRAAAESSGAPSLPGPTCADPAAGEWLGQVFLPERGEWYEFRLAIVRGEGEAVAGEIAVDHWRGPIVTRARVRVRMRATGEAGRSTARTLRFDGDEFIGLSANYRQDRFRGELAGNLFMAADEDGTNLRLAGNGRIAFIRSACEAPPAQP